MTTSSETTQAAHHLDYKVRERKPWPSYVASFFINDMTGACKKRGLTVANCGIDPNDIRLLLHWNYEGYIDRKTARECIEYMLDQAAEVREFIDFIVHHASAVKKPSKPEKPAEKPKQPAVSGTH